jgi:hypothetical protein
MGMIEDRKKFKVKKTQVNPVNPEGIAKKTAINTFDIDEHTIKEQQNKK